MKKLNLLIIILLFVGYPLSIIAQSADPDCKVLLNSIAGFYEGECKDGLAHGKGIATGIDKYEGNFKKGLPDGFGTYTWANGDFYEGRWKGGLRSGAGMMFTQSTQKATNAVWKDGEIKKIVVRQFKILNSASLSFISIKKHPALETDNIRVTFDIPPGHDFFNSLEVEHSSGVYIKGNRMLEFKDVSYPFKAEVKFVISGMSFVIHKSCIAEFEIYEDGGWIVLVKE